MSFLRNLFGKKQPSSSYLPNRIIAMAVMGNGFVPSNASNSRFGKRVGRPFKMHQYRGYNCLNNNGYRQFCWNARSISNENQPRIISQ
jgi:hypothetical protein